MFCHAKELQLNARAAGIKSAMPSGVNQWSTYPQDAVQSPKSAPDT